MNEDILHEIVNNTAIARCDASIDGTNMVATWIIIDRENKYQIKEIIYTTK